MVKIVPYRPEFAEAFRLLNYEWIEAHFQIEASDRKMLEDPEGAILKKGGVILFATLDEKPVGTCALVQMSQEKYELAKMAVSKEARGNKVGWHLGLAAIEKGREIGAKRLYLETNHVLQPAINLYKKLGFEEVTGVDSPYERCDIQMELAL